MSVLPILLVVLILLIIFFVYHFYFRFFFKNDILNKIKANSYCKNAVSIATSFEATIIYYNNSFICMQSNKSIINKITIFIPVNNTDIDSETWKSCIKAIFSLQDSYYYSDNKTPISTIEKLITGEWFI